MLESVVKRSEFVYRREQRYTKVIYYFLFIISFGGRIYAMDSLGTEASRV